MDKKIPFPTKVINTYINSIKQEIPLEGVFLFGSFAYGNPTKHSDVDLVFISSSFKKKSFLKRGVWLQKKRWGVATSVAMDVVGYTPEEFAHIEDESSIMAYAKKHGRWLYKSNKE